MAAAGRTLIGAGLLVLAFVAYQLWGTSLAEGRSQNKLRSSFTDQFQTARGHETTPAVQPETPEPPQPLGGAVAIIRIPKIGVDKAVVQGVGVPDLKKGPGHYPGTPLPGEAGNAAIAGHRTTYGAPFFRLNELAPGDPILVTTLNGSYRYEVTTTQVVRPSQTEVLNASSDNRLTLTTCEPRFSAAKRLIVVAALVGADETVAVHPEPGRGEHPKAPAPEPTVAASGLSGEDGATLPAVVWGADAAAVAFALWRLAKRGRRWLIYLLGSPVFLVLLYLFFENFSKLLPANY